MSSQTWDHNHRGERCSRERSPPPRYEEAISYHGGVSISADEAANATRNEQQNNNPDIHNSNSEASGSASRIVRYRSASPGGLSEGAQETSSQSGTEHTRKKSRVAKIKKGIGNLAFFIIQILD